MIESAILDSLEEKEANMNDTRINGIKVGDSFFQGDTIHRPKHNSHCYVQLNHVYKSMAEPKLRAPSSQFKVQKTSVVKPEARRENQNRAKKQASMTRHVNMSRK